jgi:hypothetical protein
LAVGAGAAAAGDFKQRINRILTPPCHPSAAVPWYKNRIKCSTAN